MKMNNLAIFSGLTGNGFPCFYVLVPCSALVDGHCRESVVCEEIVRDYAKDFGLIGEPVFEKCVSEEQKFWLNLHLIERHVPGCFVVPCRLLKEFLENESDY